MCTEDAQHRPRVASPRLRGEVDFERSEKSGEGDSQFAQTRGHAPSPGSLRDPTSPRKRGEVGRRAVHDRPQLLRKPS